MVAPRQGAHLAPAAPEPEARPLQSVAKSDKPALRSQQDRQDAQEAPREPQEAAKRQVARVGANKMLRIKRPQPASGQAGQLAASLRSAANEGKVELVRLLLRCGADVNDQDDQFGNTALHQAAWNGFSETVQLLCKHRANTSIRNKAQFTPLHLASQQGHNQCARLLLMASAKCEAKNSYGDTPLHTAARYGHAGAARILLSARANVNQLNKNNDTPLHIAAAMGRRKLTRIFMQQGAEPAIKNNQAETPMDIALRKDLIDIQELIANPPPLASGSRADASHRRLAGRPSRPNQSRRAAARAEAAPGPGSPSQLHCLHGSTASLRCQQLAKLLANRSQADPVAGPDAEAIGEPGAKRHPYGRSCGQLASTYLAGELADGDSEKLDEARQEPACCQVADGRPRDHRRARRAVARRPGTAANGRRRPCSASSDDSAQRENENQHNGLEASEHNERLGTRCEDCQLAESEPNNNLGPEDRANESKRAHECRHTRRLGRAPSGGRRRHLELALDVPSEQLGLGLRGCPAAGCRPFASELALTSRPLLASQQEQPGAKGPRRRAMRTRTLIGGIGELELDSQGPRLGRSPGCGRWRPSSAGSSARDQDRLMLRPMHRQQLVANEGQQIVGKTVINELGPSQRDWPSAREQANDLPARRTANRTCNKGDSIKPIGAPPSPQAASPSGSFRLSAIGKTMARQRPLVLRRRWANSGATVSSKSGSRSSRLSLMQLRQLISKRSAERKLATDANGSSMGQQLAAGPGLQTDTGASSIGGRRLQREHQLGQPDNEPLGCPPRAPNGAKLVACRPMAPLDDDNQLYAVPRKTPKAKQLHQKAADGDEAEAKRPTNGQDNKLSLDTNSTTTTGGHPGAGWHNVEPTGCVGGSSDCCITGDQTLETMTTAGANGRCLSPLGDSGPALTSDGGHSSGSSLQRGCSTSMSSLDNDFEPTNKAPKQEVASPTASNGNQGPSLRSSSVSSLSGCMDLLDGDRTMPDKESAALNHRVGSSGAQSLVDNKMERGYTTTTTTKSNNQEDDDDLLAPGYSVVGRPNAGQEQPAAGATTNSSGGSEIQATGRAGVNLEAANNVGLLMETDPVEPEPANACRVQQEEQQQRQPQGTKRVASSKTKTSWWLRARLVGSARSGKSGASNQVTVPSGAGRPGVLMSADEPQASEVAAPQQPQPEQQEQRRLIGPRGGLSQANAELVAAQKSLALAAAAKVQRNRLLKQSGLGQLAGAQSLTIETKPSANGPPAGQQNESTTKRREHLELKATEARQAGAKLVVAEYWFQQEVGQKSETRVGPALVAPVLVAVASPSGTGPASNGSVAGLIKRPSGTNSEGMSDSSPSNNGAESDNSIQTTSNTIGSLNASENGGGSMESCGSSGAGLGLGVGHLRAQSAAISSPLGILSRILLNHGRPKSSSSQPTTGKLPTAAIAKTSASPKAGSASKQSQPIGDTNNATQAPAAKGVHDPAAGRLDHGHESGTDDCKPSVVGGLQVASNANGAENHQCNSLNQLDRSRSRCPIVLSRSNELEQAAAESGSHPSGAQVAPKSALKSARPASLSRLVAAQLPPIEPIASPLIEPSALTNGLPRVDDSVRARDAIVPSAATLNRLRQQRLCNYHALNRSHMFQAQYSPYLPYALGRYSTNHEACDPAANKQQPALANCCADQLMAMQNCLLAPYATTNGYPQVMPKPNAPNATAINNYEYYVTRAGQAAPMYPAGYGNQSQQANGACNTSNTSSMLTNVSMYPNYSHDDSIYIPPYENQLLDEHLAAITCQSQAFVPMHSIMEQQPSNNQVLIPRHRHFDSALSRQRPKSSLDIIWNYSSGELNTETNYHQANGLRPCATAISANNKPSNGKTTPPMTTTTTSPPQSCSAISVDSSRNSASSASMSSSSTSSSSITNGFLGNPMASGPTNYQQHRRSSSNFQQLFFNGTNNRLFEASPEHQNSIYTTGKNFYKPTDLTVLPTSNELNGANDSMTNRGADSRQMLNLNKNDLNWNDRQSSNDHSQLSNKLCPTNTSAGPNNANIAAPLRLQHRSYVHVNGGNTKAITFTDNTLSRDANSTVSAGDANQKPMARQQQQSVTVRCEIGEKICKLTRTPIEETSTGHVGTIWSNNDNNTKLQPLVDGNENGSRDTSVCHKRSVANDEKRSLDDGAILMDNYNYDDDETIL